MRLSRAALSLALLLTARCSEPPAPPVKTNLSEGAVARVGDDTIRAESVTRIASAQRVSLEEARTRAISDALFAAEARGRGFDGATRYEQTAALGRLMIGKLRDEARAQGPATDAELDEVTTRRWFELDRPAGKWTVLVHVAVATTAAAGSEKRAEVVARRIRDELMKLAPMARDEAAKEGDAGIDPAALATRAAGVRAVEAAKAVSSDGFEVVAQTYPAFAADAKTVEPGQRREVKQHVADAAAQLTSPGDVGEPFVADGGVNVMMLLGLTRASQFPLAERRAMVNDEIVARRTNARLTSLLEELATRSPVEVDRQVDGLLGLVQVSPPP